MWHVKDTKVCFLLTPNSLPLPLSIGEIDIISVLVKHKSVSLAFSLSLIYEDEVILYKY